jgi:hypothetical protein
MIGVNTKYCSSLGELIIQFSLSKLSGTCRIITNKLKVNVKVKLSLCFLNEAPRHEGVLGSGGIAPRIL